MLINKAPLVLVTPHHGISHLRHTLHIGMNSASQRGDADEHSNQHVSSIDVIGVVQLRRENDAVDETKDRWEAS